MGALWEQGSGKQLMTCGGGLSPLCGAHSPQGDPASPGLPRPKALS